MNTTPWLAGILTGAVAFAVCVPLFGGIFRRRQKKVVGFVLATIVALVAGLTAGMLLGKKTAEMPPVQEGADPS